MFDLLYLITIPLSLEVEQRRFSQTQIDAAARAVAFAAEARHAYFGAVAAEELARYYERVKETAEASAELARRMVEAGKLQQARADARACLLRRRHDPARPRTASGQRRARAPGPCTGNLRPASALRLPERLPEIPRAPLEPQDAERTAIEKRLDVQSAKLATEMYAKSLGTHQGDGVHQRAARRLCEHQRDR